MITTNVPHFHRILWISVEQFNPIRINNKQTDTDEDEDTGNGFSGGKSPKLSKMASWYVLKHRVIFQILYKNWLGHVFCLYVKISSQICSAKGVCCCVHCWIWMNSVINRPNPYGVGSGGGDMQGIWHPNYLCGGIVMYIPLEKPNT